jgi:hypothetical protein
MSRKFLQELIKNLQEFYKCPTCDTNYHFDDIKFLGQIDEYCFVQLTCHQCSLPVLATVSVGDNKITGRRRKADATAKEQAQFKAKGEIKADEIAEFHRFISGYKGRLVNIAKPHNRSTN